jgi:hypothetical protein
MDERRQQSSDLQGEILRRNGEDGNNNPILNQGVIIFALSIDRTTGAVTPTGTIGIGGDEVSDLFLCLDALDITAQSMRHQLRSYFMKGN